MDKKVLNIALPVMDEKQSLPVFMEALKKQTFKDFRLFICINQPEHWWQDEEKQRICRDNVEMLRWLTSLDDPGMVIIDRCSPGNGWTGKAHGIGWARKVLMDAIAEVADRDSLILSVDADTVFGPGYLASVVENLRLNPGVSGISIPYYHYLTGNEDLDRAILRYEIYMRSYAINLWRIGSPYCFTALGSAIAIPVWAYRKIGGITPKISGEDFYLLQKLVKSGKLLHWNSEIVYPAARYSTRVFFGTGPALIKGARQEWESYPVYRMELFRDLELTMLAFGKLYEKDIETPLDAFLLNKEGVLPWAQLRRHAGTAERFVRSCHEKIDGLRILQFLKERTTFGIGGDEQATRQLLRVLEKEFPLLQVADSQAFSFVSAPVSFLDDIRNMLFRVEMGFRLNHWEQICGLKVLLN